MGGATISLPRLNEESKYEFTILAHKGISTAGTYESRTYFLYAMSRSVRDEWINKLTNASKIFSRPRKNSNVAIVEIPNTRFSTSSDNSFDGDEKRRSLDENDVREKETVSIIQETLSKAMDLEKTVEKLEEEKKSLSMEIEKLLEKLKSYEKKEFEEIKKINREGELTEERLLEAVKLYDIVVNINSLSNIKKGWGIFGNLEKIFCGPVVAFVGPFKVGKTWTSSKLLGVELMYSQILPTLGISLKVPPSTKSKVIKNEDNPPKKIISSLISSRKQTPTSTFSVPLERVIVIDTAGSDRPVSSSLLKESLALEYLLQELIIEISGRIVLVLGKFDRQSQLMIRSLILQINSKHPNYPIGENRRLVVIHNYKEVVNEKVLAAHIEEVRQVYENENESDKMEQSWVPIKFETSYFYITSQITHLFLVKDVEEPKWSNEDVPFQADCGKHYNAMTLRKLQAIIGEDNIKTLNLVEEIRTRLNRNLSRYIKNWDGYKLQLKKTDGEDTLIPVVDEKNENESKKELQKFLETEGLWELEDISVSEKGVVSESFFPLEGDVELVSKGVEPKGEIIVRVKAGLVEDKKKCIKFKLRDNKTIGIYIKFTKPSSQNFNIMFSNIRYGQGFFEYELPGDMRYEVPKSLTDLYENQLSLKDGVVTLKLQEQKMS